MNTHKYFILLVLITIATSIFAQTTYTTPDDLDQTIREASNELNEYIPAKSKIVILNIASSSDALAEYIIEELIANAIKDRNFTVVDRKQLDDIREELKFQVSGEVADDQAKQIGKLFGADTIVSGRVAPFNNLFRFSIRAISVETGTVQAQYNKNIDSGRTITGLMRVPNASRTTIPRTPSSTTPNVVTTPPPTPTSPVTPVVTNPPTTVPTPNTIEYSVGDTGPAGGLIFYDQGMYAFGWRYLEAAPSDTEFSVAWGLNGIDCPGTDTRIGTGKENTDAIIKLLASKGESRKATQFCKALNINGYNDWFLPSKDELNEMYKILSAGSNIGEFNTSPDGWYWSSSSSSNNKYTWSQRFSDGYQDYVIYGYSSRPVEARVRGVRAF